MTAPRERPFDPNRGTVHLWSATGKFPTALKEVIDSRLRIVMHTDQKGDPPEVADYLVSVTQLTAAFERSAARQTALPVVLPEGGDWLRRQIARSTNVKRDVHIRVYKNEPQGRTY